MEGRRSVAAALSGKKSYDIVNVVVIQKCKIAARFTSCTQSPSYLAMSSMMAPSHLLVSQGGS